MNYEEKYKLALERAKEELRVCGSQDCDAARQIFRFFPELAESEDERIKREILELVSIAGNGNQFEEIKDWLEKHEKKAKMIDADKVIEWMKTHGNLCPVVTIRINDVIAKFKRDFGL